MHVPFKVVGKANPLNRTEQKFYPQLQHKGIVDRVTLEDRIVRETSMSKSDVRAILVIFSDLMSDYLRMGYKVRLEELGLLSLRVKTTGEENQADVGVKNVNRVSVGFRPATELIEKLANTKFEKVED